MVFHRSWALNPLHREHSSWQNPLRQDGMSRTQLVRVQVPLSRSVLVPRSPLFWLVVACWCGVKSPAGLVRTNLVIPIRHSFFSSPLFNFLTSDEFSWVILFGVLSLASVIACRSSFRWKGREGGRWVCPYGVLLGGGLLCFFPGKG